MSGLVGHGIGNVQDLPVPAWLFYWGAGIVLVASFTALGSLWRQPLLARYGQGRPLPRPLAAATSRPARTLLQLLSVVLFVAVWAAALLGTDDPLANIAPTWIYVTFWLGVPLLAVLFGDVWRVLSPWRALADGFVWVWERSGREARPLADYPAGLGRWPAAAALFGFVALELAYYDPSSPRALAFAIAVYSYITLLGMAAYGRDGWTANGEAFAVLFGLFARLSPFRIAEGRPRLRLPASGLAGEERTPGTTAFVAVMLGSVAFDGFSRTATWQDLVADVQAPYVLVNPTLADLLGMGLAIGGLLVAAGLVGVSYIAACRLAGSSVGDGGSLVPDFLLSLVPIAFVYEVAHYFSLLVLQGQFTITHISDPLGRGWDLFGTADFTPNLALLSPNLVWYVQASALVLGHMVGLMVAHDRAIARFPARSDALRSQYAMLALMVLYTLGGLWILSRG